MIWGDILEDSHEKVLGKSSFSGERTPLAFFSPIFKAGHYPFVGFHFVLCQLLTSALAVDSPTAIALGSSAKGFGAELLSDSLEFSGADPSCSAKSFRGRFHQGLSKVPPRFFKFRDLPGLLGQIRFWRAKRFCGRFPHRFFKPVP